jgi:hypothetical protein
MISRRFLARFGALALLASSILNAGGQRRSTYCYTCPRDSHGHIKRSSRAKDSFRAAHPCPSTGSKRGACPGYVIDHIRPLERGGADSPSNMQWQTKAAAKAKDRTE